MKVLIITGTILPRLGHNANLMMKILPYLKKEHEIRILSFASCEPPFPETFNGVKIYWAYRSNKHLTEKVVFPTISRFVDKNGYSDYLIGMLLAEKADELHKEYPFDVVLGSSEPFVALAAEAHIRSRCNKIIYMMDPPEITWNHPGTSYRNKHVLVFLKKMDAVFTTQYAKEALERLGCCAPEYCLKSIAFPMVEEHQLVETEEDIYMDTSKINLLFCGAMSKSLQRSPQYYLELASRLDDRFCLYFMGSGCEDIIEQYSFHTSAQVVLFSSKPYQTALNAMHEADILINIGNNVRVHLPSKIVEYMSMGKPIVNLYKFDECPTLDFTTRYPLCLNINEQKSVTDDVFDRFEQFCISNKGKKVPLQLVQREFSDWTPKSVAQTILEALKKTD